MVWGESFVLGRNIKEFDYYKDRFVNIGFLLKSYLLKE